jgi:hypothetical protein
MSHYIYQLVDACISQSPTPADNPPDATWLKYVYWTLGLVLPYKIFADLKQTRSTRHWSDGRQVGTSYTETDKPSHYAKPLALLWVIGYLTYTFNNWL